MRQILLAIAWLAAVVLIALGAAGLVAGMDAPATAGARPWLTARDDLAVGAAARRDRGRPRGASPSGSMPSASRAGALSALVANDPGDRGRGARRPATDLVADIRARSATIGTALDDVPLIGTPAAEYRLGPAVRDRHARLVAAAGRDARPGPRLGASLATGSAAATRLSDLLATHDEAVLGRRRAGA